MNAGGQRGFCRPTSIQRNRFVCRGGPKKNPITCGGGFRQPFWGPGLLPVKPGRFHGGLMGPFRGPKKALFKPQCHKKKRFSGISPNHTTPFKG